MCHGHKECEKMEGRDLPNQERIRRHAGKEKLQIIGYTGSKHYHT